MNPINKHLYPVLVQSSQNERMWMYPRVLNSNKSSVRISFCCRSFFLLKSVAAVCRVFVIAIPKATAPTVKDDGLWDSFVMRKGDCFLQPGLFFPRRGQVHHQPYNCWGPKDINKVSSIVGCNTIRDMTLVIFLFYQFS